MFGFLATLLAIVGLYGVMSYTVAQRTREIGIRMALGAAQGNVVWMVMREVLRLIAIGVAVGVPAALALTRGVESQLFGLTAHDPSTLLLATALLVLVGVRPRLPREPAGPDARLAVRIAARSFRARHTLLLSPRRRALWTGQFRCGP